MKSSFCIDLQRFMLIPTKFPLTREFPYLLLDENFLIPKANKNKYKEESKIIFIKLNSNNTRMTLPKRRNTNTLNIGSISFFFLYLWVYVITIIEDRVSTPMIYANISIFLSKKPPSDKNRWGVSFKIDHQLPSGKRCQQ